MITVFCINSKGKRFEKEFDDYHQARVFILRCLHGHNVYIEGYETFNPECDEELGRLVSYGY